MIRVDHTPAAVVHFTNASLAFHRVVEQPASIIVRRPAPRTRITNEGTRA